MAVEKLQLETPVSETVRRRRQRFVRSYKSIVCECLLSNQPVPDWVREDSEHDLKELEAFANVLQKHRLDQQEPEEISPHPGQDHESPPNNLSRASA